MQPQPINAPTMSSSALKAALDRYYYKERIPELAQGLLAIIEQEHKVNATFKAAFDSFAQFCHSSLDPQISKDTLNEMLIQHLLTERLFRTVFNKSDFISRNVIACKIEQVILALTSRSFNRYEFLKSLDRFYLAIEGAAKSITTWSERQSFLNTVYERFFQGFAIKKADTHGIVYTPQEIVDFMCASVEEVLQKEFGTSLGEPGVQILDPATGTGNFIVNLICNHISRRDLKYKYQHDLFCNEVMLLPYYVASLNIEHEYFTKMNEYEPFGGICFADTLELAEGRQLSLFVEENTKRVQREKDAEIMVMIGNPPYNVGQKSENDNNKNRKYAIIDQRIQETYAKSSKASNKNKLSDAYVKFFRWATDRLGERDGIICFISNNGFLEGLAFDGFRKQLTEEFTQIYHLDLGGNVRKQGKGNVFGIMVGIGITMLIRCRQAKMERHKSVKTVLYHKFDDTIKNTEKLALLRSLGSIDHIDWQELQPNKHHLWLTEGIRNDFIFYLPMGTKEAKAIGLSKTEGLELKTLFTVYSLGVNTNRDTWMYDFHINNLTNKASRMIETYNAEVSRWIRAGSPKDIDSFVLADETKIKWSSRLKECLARRIEATFIPSQIRNSIYRPFTRQYLYFDTVMTHRQGIFPIIFPTPATESENVVIWLKTGSEWPMFTLATNRIPDLLPQGGSQCFPFYTYSEDGSNRRENITDWALQQFQAKYGPEVTTWDIFHYTYGMLHHPHYSERYTENLKRDLPHIPLVHQYKSFEACVDIGKQLMHMHLNYEQAKEYRLKWLESQNVPFSWHVEKMRLSADQTAIIVNESITLSEIPQECFQYRLGNRSALEWVLDQYQVSTDKRSGIESDPNRLDDEEYIVRLIGKVVTVSVETVKLVNELVQVIKVEDWMFETVNINE